MSAKSIHRGGRVAHKSLDAPEGGAKSGEVVDVIGDEGEELVLARYSDEELPVAYDKRELEAIVDVPVLSRGPVLLYPRHLWQLIKRPFRRRS